MLLSLQLHASDWSEQLAAGGCRYLITESALVDSIGNWSGDTHLFSEFDDLLASSSRIDASSVPRLLLEQESVVIFTSSVTGHKKGVLLSVQNFIASATASNEITKLSPGDSWVVSLPLYHVGGLGIIYRTLLARAHGYFVPNFSIDHIAKLVSEGRVTHLSLVPTMLDALVDIVEREHPDKVSEYFSRIKAIIIAGAASSESLLEKIRRYRLPVLSAWGMTETTAHCTCMSLEDSLDRIQGVGRPFAHTKVKAIGDTGKTLTAGEVGELLVSGPTVCRGYIDASVGASPIVDSWLHTGDLGLFDEQGYLRIVGRKDDMFISGGENIHKGEIEQIGLRYGNARYCAVIPVAHPKWGQRPVMFVQAKQPEVFDSSEMVAFLREHIAKIKVPDEIILVDEMPRTAIGKIDYKQLEKNYS